MPKRRAASAPETSAPETSAPETSAPETSAPETSVSETTASASETSNKKSKKSEEDPSEDVMEEVEVAGGVAGDVAGGEADDEADDEADEEPDEEMRDVQDLSLMSLGNHGQKPVNVSTKGSTDGAILVENLNKDSASVLPFLNDVLVKIRTNKYDGMTACDAAKELHEKWNAEKPQYKISSGVWSRISVLFVVMGKQNFERFLSIMITRDRTNHLKSGMGNLKQLLGENCMQPNGQYWNTFYVGLKILNDYRIDTLRTSQGKHLTMLNQFGIGTIVDSGQGNVHQSDSNDSNRGEDESDKEDEGLEEIYGVVLDQNTEERSLLGASIWQVLEKTSFSEHEKSFFRNTLTATVRNMKDVVEMGKQLHLQPVHKWKNQETKDSLLIWYGDWAAWMLPGEADPETYAEMLRAELAHAKTRTDSIMCWTTAGGCTVNEEEMAKAKAKVEKEGPRPKNNFYRDNSSMYGTTACNRFAMKIISKEKVVVMPPFEAIDEDTGMNISKPTCEILRNGVVVTREEYAGKGVLLQSLITPKRFWECMQFNVKRDREVFMDAIENVTKGQLIMSQGTIDEQQEESMLMRVNFRRELQEKGQADDNEGCGSVYYDADIMTYKMAVTLTDKHTKLKLTKKVKKFDEIRLYSLSEDQCAKLHKAVEENDTRVINKILVDDDDDVSESDDDGAEAGVDPVVERQLPEIVRHSLSGYLTRQRAKEEEEMRERTLQQTIDRNLRVVDRSYAQPADAKGSDVSSSGSDSESGDSDASEMRNAEEELGVRVFRETENGFDDFGQSTQEELAMQESMDDVPQAVARRDGLLDWCNALKITKTRKIKVCALCQESAWRITNRDGGWDRLKTCDLVWKNEPRVQRRMYSKAFVTVPNSDQMFYGCLCLPTQQMICESCAVSSVDLSLNDDVKKKIKEMTSEWAGKILETLPGVFGACHSGCNGAYANIYQEISADRYRDDLQAHREMTMQWMKEARELRKATKNATSKEAAAVLAKSTSVVKAVEELQRMEAIQKAAGASAEEPAEASAEAPAARSKEKECVDW